MVENDFGALGKDDIEHILFSHSRNLDLHCRCSKMKEETGSLCDREVISLVKSSGCSGEERGKDRSTAAVRSDNTAGKGR